MEKRLNVRTYSGPSITALAYQSVRREVVVGFEGIKKKTGNSCTVYVHASRAPVINQRFFPAPPTYQE